MQLVVRVTITAAVFADLDRVCAPFDAPPRNAIAALARNRRNGPLSDNSTGRGFVAAAREERISPPPTLTSRAANLQSTMSSARNVGPRRPDTRLQHDWVNGRFHVATSPPIGLTAAATSCRRTARVEALDTWRHWAEQDCLVVTTTSHRIPTSLARGGRSASNSNP
jgi:hypothetical protein